MEGFEFANPFARFVSEGLADQRFTLLDIGCSSGIDQVWRTFGNRLRAFAFDPNLNEIARLIQREDLPGVTYVSAFVGLPSGDSSVARFRAQDFWARNPWARLSVVRTLDVRTAMITKADETEKTKLNLWTQVPLADPNEAVVIPRFLHERHVDDVDFVKIDVDGADFLILRSLTGTLNDAKVLGVGIEVNFFGSDDPEIHTFHNVDRLMKSNGFELFSLSARPYSIAALPAPYQLGFPAQSLWGRPLQGDAVYLRDAAALAQAQWALAAGPYKLAKLAALFSLIGQPDSAAEILLRFRSVMSSHFNIGEGLNLLTAQCISPGKPILTHSEYMAQFEADSGWFYPALDTQTEAAHESTQDTRADELALARSASDAAQALRLATEESLQRANEELRRLRQEIMSLRSATSWRLTAPLRIVADLFKRLSRRV